MPKPLYVVGKGTSRLLEARGLTTVGSDTGSADALADVIIEHRGSANGSLLFLRGDKTLDTLSQKLKEYDIGIEELVVYETAESPTFRHELECTVVNGNAPPPDWIVFFSPSGFDIVVPLVKDMGWWVDVKVASIGKTTARHITNHGGRVHAQAESPNPEKLLIAIESFGGSAL
ncbi:hypothetical protein HK101_009251 [Irineochytrium annulatum]|nr:hypothetical protein HK101_009251 [Irineochytrium annulatum]